VSAAVLAFEIALMRLLLVASWHHFAFLVISVALLGFGTSGTILCLARRRLVAAGAAGVRGLVIATAVSMPLCAAAAQLVPVEARFVPALLARQVGGWLLYWLILMVPFTLGAMTIGLGLVLARRRVALIYGANLLGSAAGAVAITGAMCVLPPVWLPAATAAAALLGAVAPRAGRRPRSLVLPLVTAAVLAGWMIASPPRVRLDPYKAGAHVARLEAQGDVARIGTAFGPRGLSVVYRGDVFHELPFLALDAAPPRLDAVLVDSHAAATRLRVDRPDDAAAVDRTLMAVPYEFVRPRPRVLLLGEIGGANAWLAARRGAEIIDIAQPDRRLTDLLLRTDDSAMRVFDQPGVAMLAQDPRHVVQHPPRSYDLVQLVGLESLGAGAGSVAGLAENHLVTVEGIIAALDALDADGILSVCRGIQSPPRDNLKLLATVGAALRHRGVDDPAAHVVIVRDYLAVCTMTKRSPWSAAEIERVRTVCRERSLTPAWFAGIHDGELNRPDEMPGPRNGPGDWYHHAATHLLDPALDPAAFIDGWMFDIRPPTDARPFFLDFCRLASIRALRDAFGDLWLTRAELAFLFVLAATALIAASGALLTVLPLLLLGSIRRARGKGATASYFGAIGLGYLLLEMVVLSRMTHLVGDPVHAAALTIAAFLLFSGAGCLAAPWLWARLGGAVPVWIGGIAALAALEVWGVLPAATGLAGAWPFAGRAIVGVALVAPLATMMGVPMPTGLARLDAGAPALVPWAWGVNGFASVLAAPLAVVLAMTWSYHVAAGVSIATYALASVMLSSLPGGRGGRLPG
jgi:hypothetical protein